MISNQLLWIVFSTPNLDPSRSTPPLFKIFKFHPLKGWTRFVKFGEIHISSSPKILPKFRQPPDAMRGHPTKNKLKENSPHAKIFSPNTWQALFLYTFNKIQSSEYLQCRFSSVTCHRPPVHTGALGTTLSPWPEHRTPAWTDAGVGGGEHLHRRQPLWWQSPPWRPTEPAPARNAVLRRPTLPSPPRSLMHASAPRSTIAVARQAQGAPSAADGPAPPRSVETNLARQIQPGLASKWNP